MKILDSLISDRLADAALLLLDAAREAAKQCPAYQAGALNTAPTMALAVQALIVADHWPHGGDRKPAPIPADFPQRWRGVAQGLGASIGCINSDHAQTIALLMAASTMSNAASGTSVIARGAQ